LSDYRRRPETALALASTQDPAATVRADLHVRLRDVLASRTTAPGSPMPDDHRPEIVQLTSGELDRYANQLTRCLKALATSAPIRARVQHELAEVRAEQDTRARTGRAAPQRHYDAAGLTFRYRM